MRILVGIDQYRNVPDLPGDTFYTVSSCVSSITGLPVSGVEPFTRICEYCRGALTAKERECPGCGARKQA